MFFDLAGGKQLAQAKFIDAGIVGNRGQVLHALADKSFNQVGGDAAESKTAHHNYGAVLHVAEGFLSTGNDFIHKQMILNSCDEWVQSATAASGKKRQRTSESFPSGSLLCRCTARVVRNSLLLCAQDYRCSGRHLIPLRQACMRPVRTRWLHTNDQF